MGDFFRRNHFLLRRLHSLTGIAPVGGFLIFHLWENYKSWDPAKYNHAVESLQQMPFLWFLEVFVIILPLYFHALYGVYIAMEARYGTVTEYPYERNWAFWLQRVTGLITLAFVTQHLYHFRFQKLIGVFHLPTHDILATAFSNNIMFAWYIIGTLAAVYHLCNGIYTFLITWGITLGPRSQRISAVVSHALFLLIGTMGVLALVGFRVTG